MHVHMHVCARLCVHECMCACGCKCGCLSVYLYCEWFACREHLVIIPVSLYSGRGPQASLPACGSPGCVALDDGGPDHLPCHLLVGVQRELGSGTGAGVSARASSVKWRHTEWYGLGIAYSCTVLHTVCVVSGCWWVGCV